MNDQIEHAEELATLFHRWDFNHVTLTPFNPIADSEFKRPTKAKVSSSFKIGVPEFYIVYVPELKHRNILDNEYILYLIVHLSSTLVAKYSFPVFREKKI